MFFYVYSDNYLNYFTINILRIQTGALYKNIIISENRKMNTRLRYIINTALIPVLLLLTSCSSIIVPSHQNAPELQSGVASADGFYLDTYVTVSVYAPEDPGSGFAKEDNYEIARSAAESSLSLCGELQDFHFSKTGQDSTIWMINHSEGRPVAADDDTIELLHAAQYYYDISDGKVDPSIGTLTELWDFHGETMSSAGSRIPSEEALSQALAHTGFDKVSIEGNIVTLLDPEIRLDPGYIAKGYIADQMREEILQSGCSAGIINLGGNVVLIGDKPGCEDGLYTVGIEKPFAEGEPILTIRVKDCSVVTSGIYERCFTENDTLYHHILDVTTGMPVNNNLCSVTIVCHDSLDADALSTTCFVLGIEKGLALIESTDGAEALFIDKDLKLYSSSGFPEITMCD